MIRVSQGKIRLILNMAYHSEGHTTLFCAKLLAPPLGIHEILRTMDPVQLAFGNRPLNPQRLGSEVAHFPEQGPFLIVVK